MHEKRSSRFRLADGGNSGLPVSLQEPYRVIQAEEGTLLGTARIGGRVLRFLDQHPVFHSAAAVLLGGLFGLALVWALGFWVH